MIIGVTGKIGSGKSSFAKYVSDKHPYVVCDLDDIVKELYSDDDIKSKLKMRFGTDDKSELRKMIDSIRFLDDIADIFAPEIKKFLDKNLCSLEGCIDVIMDAPLLFEYDLDAYCDVTVSIDADVETRYKRVKQRCGMSRPTFDLINASQLSEGSRNARASFVVCNNGSKQNFYDEIDGFLTEYI